MKFKPYKSCNCRMCNSSRGRKRAKKRIAHRLFRRISRNNLRKGRYGITAVSTGYSD